MRKLAVVLLLISAVPALLAQRAPSSEGSCGSSGIATADIRVRIVTNDNIPVSEQVRVQLIGGQGIPVSEKFSQSDGLAEFSGIPLGSYSIRIIGMTVESTTTDQFSVGCERQHFEIIHVKPVTADKDAGSKQGTVSASTLNIPPKAKSEFEKGSELLSRGDYEHATEKLKKAIELYPKYAAAYNSLGVIYVRENKKGDAKAAWQKATEVDAKFTPAYLNLARLSLGEGDVDGGEKLIQKALTVQPGSPDGLLLLCNVESSKGQYDDVLANAKKVHAAPHQGFADIHLAAADAYLHQNRPQDALSEYEIFLKEDPNSYHIGQVHKAMAQIQATLH